jgi:hypothetical protein
MHLLSLLLPLLSLLEGAVTAAVKNSARDVAFKTSPDGYKYHTGDSKHHTVHKFTLPNGSTVDVTFHANFTAVPVDSAAPAPTRSLSKRVSWTQTDAFWDLCGDSSFINHSSGGSPRVVDCLVLHDLMATYGGYFSVWTWDINGWTSLMSTGTCQFGVSGNVPAYVGWVGNTDARDLIWDSIQRFQWSGLVGAEGHMPCQQHLQSTYGTWNPDWAIWHT